MKLELAIAGLCCFVLACGHSAIGLRWILPELTHRDLPGTPFGSPRLTLGMLRFTWHVVTLMLVGFGALLITLAAAPDADPETLVLRWLAALWLAATALAVWSARRRPQSIVSFPVPLVMLVIAVMSWAAST
jgi:succinate dehydrogenase hydrophobic anchor subunit